MSRKASLASIDDAKGLSPGFWETGCAPELKGDEKFFHMPLRLGVLSAGAAADAEAVFSDFAGSGSLAPPILENEGMPVEAQPPSVAQTSIVRIVCPMR